MLKRALSRKKTESRFSRLLQQCLGQQGGIRRKTHTLFSAGAGAAGRLYPRLGW